MNLPEIPSSEYQQQLEELSSELVSSERYGRVALSETFTPVELIEAYPDLPATHMMYGAKFVNIDEWRRQKGQ